jgi:hypothetical protein
LPAFYMKQVPERSRLFGCINRAATSRKRKTNSLRKHLHPVLSTAAPIHPQILIADSSDMRGMLRCQLNAPVTNHLAD